MKEIKSVSETNETKGVKNRNDSKRSCQEGRGVSCYGFAIFTGAENVSEPIAAKIREVLGEEEQAERGKNGPIVLVVPQKRMAFYTELMQRFMEHMPLYDFQIICFRSAVWRRGS